VFALPCMLVCSFVLRKSHAGPRVQQAPGLPCALSFQRGPNEDANLGRTRREIAKSYLRRMGRAKRNPSSYAPAQGIDGYRCAPPILRDCDRNDVERCHQAATPRAAATFDLDHVAGLPFWSRGCSRLPVVACSMPCSKASPHFRIMRHV
jgi:hypothetical protein